MAKYKVLEKSYLDGRIYEAGDTYEFDGKPGSNLELIEEEKPVKANSQKAQAESV